MRVSRSVNLTREQVRAQLRLFTAISAVQQDGLVVPCTDDPPSWDKESMNPAACNGCPVFKLCTVYARPPGRCVTASLLDIMPMS